MSNLVPYKTVTAATLLSVALTASAVFHAAHGQGVSADVAKEATKLELNATREFNDSHDQTQRREPRVALALGGGGTRGIAHVGVLRVLKREGIPVHCIAGTSMGAIIGGLYCAGQNVDDIEKRMLSRSFLRSYHTVPIPVRVAIIPLFLLPHLVGYHPYDGLYRGNRFAKYMNHCVAERERDIESLSPTFCAVAANLLDGKAYSITRGNLGKALQATAAIPALRKPVKIGDELLVDGGVEANLPAKQARAMGADIVIAINVDETFPRADDKEFRRIGSVSQRVLSMILAKIDEEQVAASDIVIQPEVNGIHLLSTKKTDARRAVAAGEKAAEEALPKIRQLLSEYGAKSADASAR